VGRNNCDLSLIGEPPCWGSGELPLLPPSWARALRKISLNSIVKDLGNGLEWQSDKRVKPEELCGVDWASKVKNLKSVDRSFRVGDLIISALCKENFGDSTALDIHIVELNLAGVPGGSKVPLQIKTRDALLAVGLFSDDGINELLSGTYLELIQRLKDLAVVLDFAITTTAWLKRSPLDENIVFQVPETSETMTEAFRTMRMRVVRNIGYSPEANWYTSNFADVLGKRFGFDWQGKWTLDECGEDLGLTRERLRQIERKAQLSFSSRQWGDSPALRNAVHELLAHAGNEFYFTDTDKRVLWVDRNAIEYLLTTSGCDEIEFQKTLDEIKRDGYKIKLNSVVLNTRGGNSNAAMEIGKIIRKEKLNTYVGTKHRCASACIYILSSGIIRMAYGEVAVHRPTYDDDYPYEKLEESLKKSEAESMKHLMEMGMTTQLIEAIRITPSWTTWTLDDKEKRRWGVHGTERMYDELWFRTTAKAKFYDTDVVRDFFYRHNEKCTKMAKEFKMTVYDCVKAEM
jgi:hypothetical protein